MTPRRLDPATIQEKLHLLAELVGALHQLASLPAHRVRDDILVRLALERAVTQGVELVVAVCSHAVGATTAAPTRTYRDAVLDAVPIGVLDAQAATSLAAAVGLRTLLTHEYARIDLDRLAALVPQAERDFDAFVRSAAAWTAEQG